MKAAGSWITRALLAVVCVFLTARSVRIAVADLRSQRNGMDGLNAAIQLEPGDSALVARAALFRNDNGDTSPEVDRELRRAAELDPLNADLQMALGLRAEFLGHQAEAERYLVRAAEIDHTFKPAWTLASYYARNDQPGKTWPMIQRALNLNPLVFDPAPVFDLAWNESGDSKKILAVIPARGRMPVAYLWYLVTRKKAEAALEFWPHALGALDPADAFDVDVSTGFVDFLEQVDRTPDAVRVWNQIVERGILQSGRLDPAAGVSIANPDFSFPLIERGFGWRVAQETGVAVEKGAASLRFEFDGNEPESSLLLTTAAPLIPGKGYRILWKTDTSRLSSPKDPGFLLQIVQEPGDVASECPPLLQAGDDGACRFTSRPNANRAQINLIYRRALGTTRVEGMLQILSVRLGFAS